VALRIGQRRIAAEERREEANVVPIHVAWLVAQAVTELQFGRQAADAPLPDRAFAAQAGCRVSAPLSPTELLPAVPRVVEEHGVKVDLTPGAVAKDDARRHARLDARIVGEAEQRERALGARDLRAWQDEVEVLVRSRLSTEERVHAPAAVEPGLEARRLEPVEDGEDVLRSHGR
jgi:hypothetical protein